MLRTITRLRPPFGTLQYVSHRHFLSLKNLVFPVPVETDMHNGAFLTQIERALLTVTVSVDELVRLSTFTAEEKMQLVIVVGGVISMVIQTLPANVLLASATESSHLSSAPIAFEISLSSKWNGDLAERRPMNVGVGVGQRHQWWSDAGIYTDVCHAAVNSEIT